MKKVLNTTTTYQYNDDYFIDVVQYQVGSKFYYEAWLYNKNYGVKMLMFGLESPTIESYLWEFLDQVEENVLDYISDYKVMYMND